MSRPKKRKHIPGEGLRLRPSSAREPAVLGGGLGWTVALVATVLMANAGIMALELVAGRLVARYLGQSLYTWTAIIGVVLTAMSVGNYGGGKLADRFEPLRLLALVFLMASAACLAILPLNARVGTWVFARELAWPARILVHITLTFLVPCIFLGAISPIIARFAVLRTSKPGRSIGLIYGAAAAGSIGGTFLTGFWLLGAAPSSTIVGFVAGLLVLLALAYGAAAWMSGSGAGESRVETLRSAASAASRRSWVAVNATVFLANASFMVFELTASRMATQHLGYSLYTWTTLLGSVLAGIALGNLAGGLLADRFQAKKLLSLLFVFSAAACLATPALSTWLGEGTLLDGLPWVARTVWHIVLAFVLPALLLGTTGPVIARIALGLGRAPGGTLGSVYAWGAAGSVGGCFLAGFVLIDRLWPAGTLCTLAALLALLGAAYARRSKSAYLMVGICALALAGAFVPWKPTVALGEFLGFRETMHQDLLYVDHSQYSRIAVSKNPGQANERALFLDALLHSRVNLAEPARLEYDYEVVYQGVLDRCFPNNRPISALMIGGGGYVFPRHMEMLRPGSHIEVVEIDPAVTKAAREALGFPRDSTIRVSHMDGRNRVDDLLRRKQAGLLRRPFDCIIGDSVNQYSVPFQLTTLEFHQALAGLLSDEGLYLLNLIDGLQSGRFLASVVKTCGSVFPQVYVFTCAPRALSDRDTFVVVCAKKELDLDDLPRRMRVAHRYQGELLSPSELDALVTRSGGILLTDDYAPVDNLLATIVNTQTNSHASGLGSTVASLLARGKGEEAVKRIRAALEARPTSRTVKEYLAFTLAQMGEQEEAVQLFRGLLDNAPEDPELHYNLATALAELGRMEEAIPHYRSTLRRDPTVAQAQFVIGQYLLREGKEREALDYLLAATRFQPNNGYAHYLLGKIRIGQDNSQQALPHLREAARLLPDNKEVHYSLGIVLVNLSRYEEAETHFRRVLSKDPAFTAAWLNLGSIQYLNGNLEEAARCYAEVVRISPGSAVAYLNLGTTRLDQGRYHDAIAHFEKALALDPNLAAAQAALRKAKSGLDESG